MKPSYPSYKQMKQELDYDTLYDLYINKKLSCNKISKMYPEISTRTPITNALKKFGIYYLRQPSINQFD